MMVSSAVNCSSHHHIIPFTATRRHRRFYGCNSSSLEKFCGMYSIVLWCVSDVLSKHTHFSDVFITVHNCIDQVCDMKGTIFAKKSPKQSNYHSLAVASLDGALQGLTKLINIIASCRSL